MKKLILYALASLFLLAGCNKLNTVTYSGIEAGTISSGVFTTDNGTVMTVSSNPEKFDVTSTRRVLISYVTLPVTDPDHLEFEVLGLLDAGILPAHPIESQPEEPDGTPLQVSDAWFSANYLNILAVYTGQDPTKHVITADYTADEQGIVIRIHHDGSQESYSGTNVLSCFLSIPVSDPVLSYEQCAQAAGLKNFYPATVVLQWTARTLDAGPLAIYERKGSYSPPAAN